MFKNSNIVFLAKEFCRKNDLNEECVEFLVDTIQSELDREGLKLTEPESLNFMQDTANFK